MVKYPLDPPDLTTRSSQEHWSLPRCQRDNTIENHRFLDLPPHCPKEERVFVFLSAIIANS